MRLSQNFIITGNSSVINTNFFHPVTLNDGYYLALSGFSSGSICNVTSKNGQVFLKGRETEAVVPIPKSYYHTVGSLLTVLKDSINKFLKQEWGITKEATLKFAIRSNLWTLSMPSGNSISTCKNDPSNVFNLMEIEDGDFETVSVVETTFYTDIELAFLYCSIVQESNINARESRLLDIIPLKTNTMYNYYEPHNLKFRKIAIEEFTNISFEIRDSSGELLEFAAPHAGCSIHSTSFDVVTRPVVLCLKIVKGI